MTDNTNPGAAAPGSEASHSPMSLDDAAKAFASNGSFDDDEAPVEEAEAVKSDSEPDDFALAEGEEEAASQEEEGEKPAEPALASEDMVVEVDGERIPVSELKKSRLLEQDYTRAKQALSQERAQMQELGTQFSGALERVVEYLVSKLPPEPDRNLAFTDPGLHYQQMAMHQAALAEMQGILGLKQGAEQASQMLSEAEFKALMSNEDSNLIKQMPHLKDPKRMDAFNRTVTEGAKALGFTEEEIKTTADHRIRLMAYHAAYGVKARAEAQKAKAKVAEAKPMLPVRQNRPEASSQVAAAQKRFNSNPTPENAAALYALTG